MNANDLINDISNLSNLEGFVRFLKHIHERRESYISDLYEASTEEIQKISGSISALDEILKICDWDNLRIRFKDCIN